MKSCVMAGWLMTVSVGNAIVVIFAEARLTDNMVRTGLLFSYRFKCASSCNQRYKNPNNCRISELLELPQIATFSLPNVISSTGFPVV